MRYFLIVLIFLVGCSQEPKQDLNREGVELLITVHVYDNKQELLEATKKYNTTKEAGLAVWNNIDNKCDIYVVRPKSRNSNEHQTWGHELSHCVYGSFH